jgi:hypothetical protein
VKRVECFSEVSLGCFQEHGPDQLVQVDQLLPQSDDLLVFPYVEVREDDVVEVDVDQLVRYESHHALH